jgi:hypothetical protein
LADKGQNKENFLIKIYILALFLCGIGLWFAVNTAPKEKVSVDIQLEHKIVDALAANGVKQTDIISQYVRERETTTKLWNEFYKKIKLQGDKRPENFENSLRTIARSMKLGLSKTNNVDGSVTYKYYSSNINYSNITFISPKKTISSSSSKRVSVGVKEKKPSSTSKTSLSKAKSSSSTQSKTKNQPKDKK